MKKKILCIFFCITLFCSTCYNVPKNSDKVTHVWHDKNIDSNVIRNNIDTMTWNEILGNEHNSNINDTVFIAYTEYFFPLSEDFWSYFKEYVIENKRKGEKIDSVKEELLHIMDMREDSIDKWWRDTP